MPEHQTLKRTDSLSLSGSGPPSLIENYRHGGDVDAYSTQHKQRYLQSQQQQPYQQQQPQQPHQRYQHQNQYQQYSYPHHQLQTPYPYVARSAYTYNPYPKRSYDSQQQRNSHGHYESYPTHTTVHLPPMGNIMHLQASANTGYIPTGSIRSEYEYLSDPIAQNHTDSQQHGQLSLHLPHHSCYDSHCTDMRRNSSHVSYQGQNYISTRPIVSPRPLSRNMYPDSYPSNLAPPPLPPSYSSPTPIYNSLKNVSPSPTQKESNLALSNDAQVSKSSDVVVESSSVPGEQNQSHLSEPDDALHQRHANDLDELEQPIHSDNGVSRLATLSDNTPNARESDHSRLHASSSEDIDKALETKDEKHENNAKRTTSKRSKCEDSKRTPKRAISTSSLNRRSSKDVSHTINSSTTSLEQAIDSVVDTFPASMSQRQIDPTSGLTHEQLERRRYLNRLACKRFRDKRDKAMHDFHEEMRSLRDRNSEMELALNAFRAEKTRWMEAENVYKHRIAELERERLDSEDCNKQRVRGSRTFR